MRKEIGIFFVYKHSYNVDNMIFTILKVKWRQKKDQMKYELNRESKNIIVYDHKLLNHSGNAKMKTAIQKIESNIIVSYDDSCQKIV